MICTFLSLRIMIINLEQIKIHFDLRLILTYNTCTHFARRDQETCPLNKSVPLIEVIITKIIRVICQLGLGEVSASWRCSKLHAEVPL